jgi:hypothetical protein
MTKIYYLFSSITFLQFYIPLVIESSKRGHKNIFILRKNYKEYANPFNENNFKILETYLKKYQIKIKIAEQTDLSKIKGLVFLIDGDIYGPPRKQALDESLLFKLNTNNVITISMTEHMNFWPVYHFFIEKIKYVSFSNKCIVDQLDSFDIGKIDLGGVVVDTNKSYKSNKNVYLGNTKLDNIPSKDDIYDKFKLDKNQKYCLFLFPKIRNKFNSDNILNIYSHLKKLNFKVIVKTRPKDPFINDSLKGDYFVSSDIYPNESLELMKISDLCIISSSSANEETIFSKIPCIDLISDLRAWERNKYLLDDKTCVRIENDKWKNISFENFNEIYNNSSENIFNFIENKHPELFK